MNEDLGKNILLETITEYEGYSDDTTKLPEHLVIVKSHYDTNKKASKELEVPFAECQKTINETKNVDYNKEINKTKELNKKLKKFLNKEKIISSRKNKIDNKIVNTKHKLEIKTTKTPNFFESIFGIHKEKIVELKKKIVRLEKKKKIVEVDYEAVCETRKNVENQIKEKKLLISKLQELNSLKSTFNKYKGQRETILQEIEKCEKYFEVNSELYNFLETSLDNYFNKNSQEIASYCCMLLKYSLYKGGGSQSWNLKYIPNTKNLIIDFNFPPIKQISNVKEVRYLKTRDEYKDIYYSKTEFNKLYDNLLYQITLLTIYELFIFDKVEAIGAICFNGWLKSKDKSTGHDANNCILSIQTNKTEFLDLDLRYVDCKDCFKKLKGIANSKLHSVIPVAPIITINREDDRFITPRNIQENLVT